MNIYQKLLNVRKAVPFLKKENTGYQFKYVSSSQTLGALREAMDDNGLVLVPKVTGERAMDHTTKKGEHQYFTVLNMEFIWVNAENPEETIVCPWVGQGIDDGEKGVGKALTYAEKFFLLKFFNIPTDKDDPDANQKKPDTTPQKQQTRPAMKPIPKKEDITEEAAVFASKCAEFAMSEPEITAFKKYLFKQSPTRAELKAVNDSFNDNFDKFVESKAA